MQLQTGERWEAELRSSRPPTPLRPVFLCGLRKRAAEVGAGVLLWSKRQRLPRQCCSAICVAEVWRGGGAAVLSRCQGSSRRVCSDGRVGVHGRKGGAGGGDRKVGRWDDDWRRRGPADGSCAKSRVGGSSSSCEGRGERPWRSRSAFDGARELRHTRQNARAYASAGGEVEHLVMLGALGTPMARRRTLRLTIWRRKRTGRRQRLRPEVRRGRLLL